MITLLLLRAAKKVDLSDAGVVGRLGDGSEEKDPAVPWYMEAATGTGPDLGRPDFPSSIGTAGGTSFFWQQQQQQDLGNFR
jgi:epsin